MTNLTQDFLCQILSYDADTGILTHKERPRSMFTSGYKGGETSWKTWNTQNAGKPITDIGSGGYLRVTIDGKKYQAHRIIWVLLNGEWPEEVDHINGAKTDNRACNLRSVNRQENLRNLARRSDNNSGYTGVSYSKRDGVFIAYITVDGHTKVLGRYATAEEAAAERAKAQDAHGFHPNHGRIAS